MKKNGGDLVVKALEDEGVKFTFGIPGTHNIELYDALERGERVAPIVITDEQSAGFMADAVARTSDSVAVVNVVPGAGVTHSLSGIGEAFLDQIPLVVLACGIRSDQAARAFQLHDVDQKAILAPLTKAVLRPASGADLYVTIRKAFQIARQAPQGPVAVEVPAELYFLAQDAPTPAFDASVPPPREPSAASLNAALELINKAKAPALYVGLGARGAGDLLIALAERLQAPVTTTISGKGVFPESHPLWLWNGFGPQAPPFVNDVMGKCDALIAIGCRFSEVATASYGLKPPEDLVHVDIDPRVFDRNYKAKVTCESDARVFVQSILGKLPSARNDEALRAQIARGHAALADERRRETSEGRVSPAALFEATQSVARDAIHIADSGTGTFLAMENLRLDKQRSFCAPVDYSCMGYSVPAAIGAKLANPTRDVIAYPGDGALLMTGLELLTASSLGIAPVLCVLRDEEYGQIAQFQRASGALSATAKLVPYSCEALARATGCEFLGLASDGEAKSVIARAVELSKGGRPVMVEVKIDQTKLTYFAKGALVTNFHRLPLGDKVRKIFRFATRKLTGALAPPETSH